jgi:hypothetical protein
LLKIFEVPVAIIVANITVFLTNKASDTEKDCTEEEEHHGVYDRFPGHLHWLPYKLSRDKILLAICKERKRDSS